MISVDHIPPDRWVAQDDDGAVAGRVRLFVRPDARSFALFGPDGADAVGAVSALLDAVLAAADAELRIELDADDGARLALLTGRGFTVDRREHVYELPTRPAGADVMAPDGFSLRSAAEVEVADLCALDEALRRDVPGVGEWHNDLETFRHETFGDPEFDPATYLVAVDGHTGGLAGLVRVWARPGGPRLGLIGVLPRYRGRGLARALIGTVLGVLHARGAARVVCEVDETNAASNALMGGFEARRVGGNVELLHHRSSRRP